MNVDLWMFTAAANAVLVLVYGAIAFIMLKAIVQGRQLLSNPILTSTFAIFLTCTIGHGLHLEHALAPAVGVWLGYADPADAAAIGAAVRATFSDPRLLAWDIATAFVAIWYWTVRTRFQLIFKGAALCEDMAQRQQQAQQIHDDVVQGLVKAKLALELGQREQGLQAVEETLASSKRIITDVLGEKGGGLGLAPGDLRRESTGG